ncbi:MAG TPA: hypothetical protein VFO41_10855 [Alphaproteobacteria bacterium]|nr:hypothetical protein [Alphaproteobacteria bacterium]
MKQLFAPLAAGLVVAACAGGAGLEQTAGRCFPAQNEDLMPPVDQLGGRQLICGTSRLKPGAIEKYRDRYPDAFDAAAP